MQPDSEEFFVYSAVKDFEYVLDKWPEKVLEFAQDSIGMQNKLYKALLNDMSAHYKVKIDVTSEKE